MAIYDVGDLVTCSATFAVNDTPTDPTVLTFSFKTPAGTTTTYTYGTDAALVRDSAGAFHVDVPVDAEGVWHYRFAGTGAATAAEERRFYTRGRNA